MRGHLHLHIGPPKSGTTSLQYALECIEHPQFVYGGVYQPRERNRGSLASRLHHALNDDHQGAGFEIREEILRLVSAGKYVVISEEMLLLTQGARTWQNKLAALNSWFEGIPTTVVISLRDPAEGVPSLYQQLFGGLPLRQKWSFDRFCESNTAACYDFSWIREHLDKLGWVEEIRYITFDAICEGRIASRDLFGERDVLQMPGIPIGHANAGAKRNRHAERQLSGITLKNFGQLPAARKLIDRFQLRRAPVYRRLVAALDRVALRPPGYRALVMPAQSAERFQASYQQALAVHEKQQSATEHTGDIASRNSC